MLSSKPIANGHQNQLDQNGYCRCATSKICWPSAGSTSATRALSRQRLARRGLPGKMADDDLVLAGRCGFAGRCRGRASHKDTRPGSGGTRCLCVPIAVATSDGFVARVSVDEVVDRDDRPLVK